jgi:hypothetical protein
MLKRLLEDSVYSRIVVVADLVDISTISDGLNWRHIVSLKGKFTS